jgi:hypothetical protein
MTYFVLSAHVAMVQIRGQQHFTFIDVVTTRAQDISFEWARQQDWMNYCCQTCFVGSLHYVSLVADFYIWCLQWMKCFSFTFVINQIKFRLIGLQRWKLFVQQHFIFISNHRNRRCTPVDQQPFSIYLQNHWTVTNLILNVQLDILCNSQLFRFLWFNCFTTNLHQVSSYILFELFLIPLWNFVLNFNLVYRNTFL